MKKRKLISILSLASLVAIISIAMASVYAWYINLSSVGDIELQITKINSEVYLYSSTDSNYNGIPDLLSSYTSQELALIQTKEDQFPSNKHYYKENRVFSYVSKEAALSTSKIGSIDMKMEMGNVYPTMVKTFKFACINNSDMGNYITFSFNEKTFTDSKEIQLLSTMSVRVGRVINNDSTNVESTNTSIDLNDKIYFIDYISSLKASTVSVVGGDDAYEIDGGINFSYNSNVKDFWVLFEMESYDSLKTHKNDLSLTKDEYQALTGESLTFPLLQIGLELRIDD